MDGYLIRVPPVLCVEIITLDADAVAEFKLLHVRWWSSRFVKNTEMHRNYTSVVSGSSGECILISTIMK